MANNWTREQEIIVFNLYCKIPFQRSSQTHPDIVRIANLIGRTPSAVNLKIGNFGSFDETLKKQGIKGLIHTSKLDKKIWNEFNGKWDEFSYLSEKLIAELEGKNIEEIADEVEKIPVGKTTAVTVKQRVNQYFFRKAVLSSYNCACCITGLSTPELLIASHIKPWAKSSEIEKTNPRNGLCLNALHDKAFDRGYITITPEFKIVVSNEICDIYDGKTVERLFGQYCNKTINAPDKFLPEKEFLEFHNDVIFEGWK